MKTSRDRWIQNRYRLIETGISRRDCLAWWKERYDRLLERAAYSHTGGFRAPEHGD